MSTRSLFADPYPVRALARYQLVRRVLGTIATLLVLSASPASAANEYVKNGSFEGSLTGWGGYNATLVLASGGAVGAQAAKVTRTAGTGCGFLVGDMSGAAGEDANSLVLEFDPSAAPALGATHGHGPSYPGHKVQLYRMPTRWSKSAPSRL